MLSLFDTKGSGALSNMLSKVRDNKVNCLWIRPDVLEQLRLKWATPEWQEKSRRNSRNRQSKEGLNLHTGGSISASEHLKRMRVQNSGIEPLLFDVYRRLHKSKDNPDEFVNEATRKIAEEYQSRIAQKRLQEGEGSSSQQSDNNVYLEVVGGPNKKGRIYGLGSHAAHVSVSSSTPSSSSTDGVSVVEFAEMQTKIQALTDELQQKNAQYDFLKNKMDQWEERFRSLLIGDQFRTPTLAPAQAPPPLPISAPAPRGEDHDDREMGDDDLDYDEADYL